jgi:Domain of unknown function (DUF4398)
VIDDIDAHHHAGAHHAIGQDQIVLAGCRVPRWVVVEEHDGSGRCGCRFAKHLARMHDCGVDRAGRQDSDPKQTALAVEHDNPELLDRARPILWQQVSCQLRGRSEVGTFDTTSGERSASQLDCREHLRGPGTTDTGDTTKLADRHARQPMHSARPVDQIVGQIQCVAATRSASQYERQQLVVAESGWSETLQFLTWSIMRCNGFHRDPTPHQSVSYTQILMRLSTGFARGAWLVVVLAAISCADPPHKEMDQAQGAIDAARAAGAEQYAASEYAAATQALKQANDAVTGRDYRLALNYALESREQAQNGARTAADTRAKLRGDVERSIAEAKALIAQARARLDGPSSAQIPRGTRRSAQQRLKQIEGDLQKADAALQAEKYMEADRLLMGVKQQIQSVVTTLSRGSTSQSPRRHT